MQLVFQSMAAMLVVGLGIRLMRLARRTGGKPEFWLGGFFGIVGLSLILTPLGGQMTGTTLGRVLVTTGQAATTLGLICLIRFNWQVFRPGSTTARTFALFCGGLDLACFIVAAWMGFGPALQSDFGHVFVFSRFLILAWSCFECTTHALMMKKRLALGLADPVVTNRFALWAMWTGVLAALPLVATGVKLSGAILVAAPGEPMTATLRMLLAIIASGSMVAAVAVALAFFPPQRYQAWLRHGAGAA